MKIVTVMTAISTAAQAGNPHVLLCSDLEEANEQIPNLAAIGGVLVVMDTGPASNFDYTPSLGQEAYSLKLYAVVKQENIDTPRNEIDAPGTAESVLKALANVVRDAVAGTNVNSVKLAPIVSEKGLFDDDFGGVSTTLTFTRLTFC